jgi:hypothetical protein
MYDLVPPKSKLIEYTSLYMSGVIFSIKILDFEEDETFNSLLFKHAKKDSEGNVLKDEKGNFTIDNEGYYIECFKLFIKEVKGVEGKFSPPWRVIKEVVNQAILANTVTELEK